MFISVLERSTAELALSHSNSSASSESLRHVEGLPSLSQIGNLLNRIQSPKILNRMGGITNEPALPDLDATLSKLRDEVDKRMEGYQVTRACELIIDLLQDVSRHLSSVAKSCQSDRPGEQDVLRSRTVEIEE